MLLFVFLQAACSLATAVTADQQRSPELIALPMGSQYPGGPSTIADSLFRPVNPLELELNFDELFRGISLDSVWSAFSNADLSPIYENIGKVSLADIYGYFAKDKKNIRRFVTRIRNRISAMTSCIIGAATSTTTAPIDTASPTTESTTTTLVPTTTITLAPTTAATTTAAPTVAVLPSRPVYNKKPVYSGKPLYKPFRYRPRRPTTRVSEVATTEEEKYAIDIREDDSMEIVAEP